MKHYYIVQIEDHFGELRNVTIKADSAAQAAELAMLHDGEQLVAAWEV